MARANVGPAISTAGRPGVELGADVGTHLIGMSTVSMPIAVRVQATVFEDETTVFVGMASSATIHPGFSHVGIGTQACVSGFVPEFHVASGAQGGSFAQRLAAGVGYGVTTRAGETNLKHAIAGVELAWLGAWASREERLHYQGAYISATLYLHLSRAPDWQLSFPSTGGKN